MAATIRTIMATLALLGAVVAALGGRTAQWLDTVAHHPAPLQQILGPLAHDDRVRLAVSAAVIDATTEQLPASVDSLPGLRPRLEALVHEAVSQAMATEEVAGAWAASIDRSRVDLVAGLDAMRNSAADAPTVWLHVGPFVELGLARLTAATPAALRDVIAGLDLPADVRIPLGRPDPQQAAWAAEMLDLARGWAWWYAAAAALSIIGLAIGPRRGRWAALIFATGLGLAILLLARRELSDLAVPTGDGLVAAVQARLLDGTAESLLAWTEPVVTAGWVLLALGVLGLGLASFRHRRTDH